MLSFRSILLAVAAFATIASAIPTAPPSNDAGGISDIVITRLVGAESHSEFHADILPIKRDKAYRSVHTNRHVDADLLIKRDPVHAEGYVNAALLIRQSQAYRSAFASSNGHVDANLFIKRDPLHAEGHVNAALLIKRDQAYRSVHANGHVDANLFIKRAPLHVEVHVNANLIYE